MAPTGLGWWIAFERSIAPGGKAEDLRIAVERCVATGASWVAPRAGLDGANDADFNDASIAAFRTAGLAVYPWIYLRNRAAALRAIEGLAKWVAAGVDGVWIDAEFDYDGGAEDVRTLVLALRARGATFVGHAPPDYLGAGLLGKVPPYLAELDTLCDVIAPQVYAWEHDDRGHAYHLDRVCKGYAIRGFGPDKVAPIAAAYRPKMRGGRPTQSLVSEPQQVAADLLAFLEHNAVRACPCPSIYSLDAVSWINGPTDQVIATLAERHARHRDTDPAPSLELVTAPQTPEALRIVPGGASAATPVRAGEGEHEPDPEAA